MTQQQRCNNNTHTVLDDDDVNVDDKATEVQTNYNHLTKLFIHHNNHKLKWVKV